MSLVPQGISSQLLLLIFIIMVAATWLLWRWPMVQSTGILMCIFCLGMLRMHTSEKSSLENHRVEGVVFSEPSEKPKTIAIDLLVPKTGESVRLYLWKDNISRSLMLGSSVVVDDVSKPFVRSDGWHMGGSGMSSMSRWERIRLWFLLQRHDLLDRYRNVDASDESYAVLAAMTLGDKSALSSDVRTVYSISGASHILALSGLHLGIIYMLLYRLTAGRRRFVFSQIVIIVGIWSFAFLTGLSTSVVRSATMVSVYSLFSLAGRCRSSVNLLCFTALLMLLVQPSLLSDIGFQLSFAAVLSILLLLPLMESFFPEYYLIQHPWQRTLYNIIGVTLAAQIGVAPLIAYHFGRFSTYFLLTNFIVVPAATVILYGALFVFIIPSSGSILLWIVEILNKALGFVSRMPCASIEGLHPTLLQVCLIYSIVICLYLALRRLVNNPPAVT